MKFLLGWIIIVMMLLFSFTSASIHEVTLDHQDANPSVSDLEKSGESVRIRGTLSLQDSLSISISNVKAATLEIQLSVSSPGSFPKSLSLLVEKCVINGEAPQLNLTFIPPPTTPTSSLSSCQNLTGSKMNLIFSSNTITYSPPAPPLSISPSLFNSYRPLLHIPAISTCSFSSSSSFEPTSQQQQQQQQEEFAPTVSISLLKNIIKSNVNLPPPSSQFEMYVGFGVFDLIPVNSANQEEYILFARLSNLTISNNLVEITRTGDSRSFASCSGIIVGDITDFDSEISQSAIDASFSSPSFSSSSSSFSFSRVHALTYSSLLASTDVLFNVTQNRITVGEASRTATGIRFGMVGNESSRFSSSSSSCRLSIHVSHQNVFRVTAHRYTTVAALNYSSFFFSTSSSSPLFFSMSSFNVVNNKITMSRVPPTEGFIPVSTIFVHVSPIPTSKNDNNDFLFPENQKITSQQEDSGATKNLKIACSNNDFLFTSRDANPVWTFIEVGGKGMIFDSLLVERNSVELTSGEPATSSFFFLWVHDTKRFRLLEMKHNFYSAQMKVLGDEPRVLQAHGNDNCTELLLVENNTLSVKTAYSIHFIRMKTTNLFRLRVIDNTLDSFHSRRAVFFGASTLADSDSERSRIEAGAYFSGNRFVSIYPPMGLDNNGCECKFFIGADNIYNRVDDPTAPAVLLEKNYCFCQDCVKNYFLSGLTILAGGIHVVDSVFKVLDKQEALSAASLFLSDVEPRNEFSTVPTVLETTMINITRTVVDLQNMGATVGLISINHWKLVGGNKMVDISSRINIPTRFILDSNLVVLTSRKPELCVFLNIGSSLFPLLTTRNDSITIGHIKQQQQQQQGQGEGSGKLNRYLGVFPNSQVNQIRTSAPCSKLNTMRLTPKLFDLGIHSKITDLQIKGIMNMVMGNDDKSRLVVDRYSGDCKATETEEITVSQSDPTVSSSRSPTRILTPPPTRTATTSHTSIPLEQLLASAEEEQEEISTAAAAFRTTVGAVAVAAGPSAMLDAGRSVELLSLVSRCASFAKADALMKGAGGGSAAEQEAMDRAFKNQYLQRKLKFPESVLQFSVGSFSASSRGALIGNVFVFLPVAILVGLLVGFILKKRAPSSDVPSNSSSSSSSSSSSNSSSSLLPEVLAASTASVLQHARLPLVLHQALCFILPYITSHTFSFLLASGVAEITFQDKILAFLILLLLLVAFVSFVNFLHRQHLSRSFCPNQQQQPKNNCNNKRNNSSDDDDDDDDGEDESNTTCCCCCCSIKKQNRSDVMQLEENVLYYFPLSSGSNLSTIAAIEEQDGEELSMISRRRNPAKNSSSPSSSSSARRTAAAAVPASRNNNVVSRPSSSSARITKTTLSSTTPPFLARTLVGRKLRELIETTDWGKKLLVPPFVWSQGSSRSSVAGGTALDMLRQIGSVIDKTHGPLGNAELRTLSAKKGLPMNSNKNSINENNNSNNNNNNNNNSKNDDLEELQPWRNRLAPYTFYLHALFLMATTIATTTAALSPRTSCLSSLVACTLIALIAFLYTIIVSPFLLPMGNILLACSDGVTLIACIIACVLVGLSMKTSSITLEDSFFRSKKAAEVFLTLSLAFALSKALLQGISKVIGNPIFGIAIFMTRGQRNRKRKLDERNKKRAVARNLEEQLLEQEFEQELVQFVRRSESRSKKSLVQGSSSSSTFGLSSSSSASLLQPPAPSHRSPPLTSSSFPSSAFSTTRMSPIQLPLPSAISSSSNGFHKFPSLREQQQQRQREREQQQQQHHHHQHYQQQQNQQNDPVLGAKISNSNFNTNKSNNSNNSNFNFTASVQVVNRGNNNNKSDNNSSSVFRAHTL